MLGSHPIPDEQQRSVTRDARQLLAKKVGAAKAREALRYVTANQLPALASLGDFDALLVAFGNFCPHCRALKHTLADTALALMQRRAQKTPVHVVMFETNIDENRDFATGTLKNRYVPAYFIVRARKGRTSIEPWANGDRVESRMSDDGELRKFVPIETLLADLATAETDAARQIDSETMRVYRDAEMQRHRAKLSQLNLQE